MHLFMSSPSTDSDLSTPSDFLGEFPALSDLQEAWSIPTLAMAEQLFSDQYGRLSAPSQEWTPSSAVRDCTLSESHSHRGDNSETLHSQNHQVSSFNLPLIYDSTLTTPVSLNPESPSSHGKTLNDAQWGHNEHPPLQYPLRSNDGIYINTSSISMKSKNDSLTMSSSDPDNMLAISPYIFDSPGTPCPPTPYWGIYGVSAPSTTIVPTSTSITSNTNPTTNTSSGSNQAPILMAPTPNRRPHQRIPMENLVQEHTQQVQHIEMKVQVDQQHIQPPPTGIKRECSTPTSRTKRRRRSAPATEQQKPLSKDDLSEEDKILLRLRDVKEEEKWDWKELTERFNRETGGKHNLAALQMRHTRLVERMRVWTDVEIRALNRAKVQYDNQKWKIIAETMLEYGCETKWSPHACQLKWQELHPGEGTPDDDGIAAWNENNTTTSSPQRQNSAISFSRQLEGDDGGGGGVDSPIIIDQTSQVTMRQRTGSKGSSRGGRSIYEKRQDWTVKPQ